jgi:diguanylate cyclase (GGDEF)-like protein
MDRHKGGELMLMVSESALFDGDGRKPAVASFAFLRPDCLTLRRYTVAIFAVALTLLFKMTSDHLVGEGPPLILFAAAVTVTAWYGGLKPGLFAITLSTFICSLLFFQPAGSFAIVSPNDRLRLIVFIVQGVLTSFLMESLHAARRRSEERMRERNQAEKELRVSEERLIYQGTHDALTGLPNRALLFRKIDKIIVSDHKNKYSFALLLLDLDRFKEINDTFGHHIGDTVLQRLRPLLLNVVRQSDTVAGLGGDEFGILLPGSDHERASAVAEQIVTALKQPIMVEEQPLEVGISIGIALYPEHGQDTMTLLRRADVAMYAAKRSKSGHAVYAAGQADYSPRRLALAGELRQGIEHNQLLLHYQPKIDLRTMRIRGAEALVRWLHPREGLIPPKDFIPLAEHTGLIKPLGLWTLHTALLQCRSWHQAGLDLNVAVNLAPENLQDGPLLKTVFDLLAESHSRPEWLTVELTETSVMTDPTRMRIVLKRLHDLGVQISIDDFGTGYSSLAYLKDLPVHEVKVDRSFVKDLTVNARNACIVRTVINLGHDLGLRVVAEGVEDQKSMSLLALWGCDLAQGYHISRPLSSVDFMSWMTASTVSLSTPSADTRYLLSGLPAAITR